MRESPAAYTSRVARCDSYSPYQYSYYDSPAVGSAGSRDGWIAALLLFGLIFGPAAVPSESLPPIRAVDFLILLLLALKWSSAVRNHGGLIFSHRMLSFTLPLLLLAVTLTVSTYMGVSAGFYRFYIKDFFGPINMLRMLVVGGLIASLRFEERQVRQFSFGLLATGALAGALALVQRYSPTVVAGVMNALYVVQWRFLDQKGTDEMFRAGGTFGNANYFSACLVGLAGGALAITINSKGILRILGVAEIVLLIGALLIATGSRTGFVGLCVVVGLAILISLHGRARLSGLFVLTLLVAIFLLVRANIDSLSLNPRMKVILSSTEAKTVMEQLSDRYGFWKRSLEAGMASPVIGIGLSKTTYQLSDNGYVMMFQRTGFVGLTLYVVMLGWLSCRGIRALYVEREPIHRIIILTGFLAVINHVFFEITGDFFWNAQYSCLLAAFAGLLCGGAADAVGRSHGEDAKGLVAV